MDAVGDGRMVAFIIFTDHLSFVVSPASILRSLSCRLRNWAWKCLSHPVFFRPTRLVLQIQAWV